MRPDASSAAGRARTAFGERSASAVCARFSSLSSDRATRRPDGVRTKRSTPSPNAVRAPRSSCSASATRPSRARIDSATPAHPAATSQPLTSAMFPSAFAVACPFPRLTT